MSHQTCVFEYACALIISCFSLENMPFCFCIVVFCLFVFRAVVGQVIAKEGVTGLMKGAGWFSGAFSMGGTRASS
jgi:hypothetical protein